MLGLIVFKQEVMLKKTLFFILFFIIATSAFAKTFNQNDMMHLIFDNIAKYGEEFKKPMFWAHYVYVGI